MTLTDLTADIARRLTAARQSVAVAESAAGGLISASLLAMPGASAYFKGGAVVYTRESRRALLELTRADVEGLEPMTEPMALAFARKARTRLDATWGVAELGIAGPAGAPYGHPPGSCVLAVDGPQRLSATVTTGTSDREANMRAFTERALALLEEALDR